MAYAKNDPKRRCQCLSSELGSPYSPGLCIRAMTGEDLLCDSCRVAIKCEMQPGPASGRLMHARWMTREQAIHELEGRFA